MGTQILDIEIHESVTKRDKETKLQSYVVSYLESVHQSNCYLDREFCSAVSMQECFLL